MKTLVLLKLPDEKGKYATCSLETLGVFPERGICYLIMDQVYEVTQVIKPISSEGGNALIIKLLNLDQPDSETIMNAVSSMINLDGDTGLTTGLDEPDSVVLVRLKKIRKQQVQLGSLVFDVQELLSEARASDTESAADSSDD